MICLTPSKLVLTSVWRKPTNAPLAEVLLLISISECVASTTLWTVRLAGRRTKRVSVRSRLLLKWANNLALIGRWASITQTALGCAPVQV